MIHSIVVAGVLGFAQGFLAVAILFGLTEFLSRMAARWKERESRAALLVARGCAFVVFVALYFGLATIWLTLLLRTDDPSGTLFKAWLGASFVGFVVWAVLLRLTSRAK